MMDLVGGLLDQVVYGGTTAGVILVFLWQAVKTLQQRMTEIESRIQEERERYHRLREELARDYVRKDDFVLFVNEIEAKMERRFERLEDLLKRGCDR